MSTATNSQGATGVPNGPFHPDWGDRNEPEDETERDAKRALAWFETTVWANFRVCSNCFARIADGYRGTVTTRSGRRVDVSVRHRTEDATLEYGHEDLPDPPQTTCECGSMRGRPAYDTLAKREALDRVPTLADRLREQGYVVDQERLADEVYALKTAHGEWASDKHVFAAAAAVATREP